CPGSIGLPGEAVVGGVGGRSAVQWSPRPARWCAAQPGLFGRPTDATQVVALGPGIEQFLLEVAVRIGPRAMPDWVAAFCGGPRHWTHCAPPRPPAPASPRSAWAPS